jgi:serine/threonine-protein kinase
LAGNVAEWTSSPFRRYPFDPSIPAGGEPRVVRGGSFINDADAIRCAARAGMPAGAVDTYVGFRLAAACDASVDRVPLVDVPGGRVAIGRDPGGRSEPVQPDESPAADVWVGAFALGATPVTNAQYATFISSTGHRLPCHWTDGAVPHGLEAHPVVYVDYADARAFCVWAGVRLPTEAEWEKAARGADGRMYPAGERAPSASDGTRPVGIDLGGTGPYGHRDLAGNVWEWVSTAYQTYPYDPTDGRERLDVPAERVLRGGSYESPSKHFRCAARSRSWPSRRARHIGFRVARALPT